jgi:hypothetical protein
MSRSKLLLSILVALIVASTCVSATASALEPELRGDFYPMNYSSTFATSTWQVPNATFKCVSTPSASEGELTGVKTMTMVIHFRGCKASESFCTSEGAAAGEIVTQPLEGTVEQRAILLTGKSGGPIVKSFKCLGQSGEVKGSLLATVANLGTEHTTELRLSFGATKEYQEALGKEKRVTALETNWLGGGKYEPVTWTFEDTLKLAPRGEGFYYELAVIEPYWQNAGNGF